MRISVGAFIPAAPFQAIASRASRRSPAGSGPTHRQTLPLGGVCVNRTSMDRGIKLIDTADVYSLGESEALLGMALKGVRTEIVLATKVRLPMSDNLNRSGATRVNIMREVEASLQRLQTDYIDLYQVHGWDSNTPLEETVRTLDDVVRQG